MVSLLLACIGCGPSTSTAPRAGGPPAGKSQVDDAAARARALYADALAQRTAGHDAEADKLLDDAVAAARRSGHGQPLTWIPERMDRAPLVSPDGTHWAAVLPHRISIREVSTGFEESSLAVDTGGLHIALLDDGRLIGAHRTVEVLGPNGKVLWTAPEDSLDSVAVLAGPSGTLALVHEATIDIVSTAPNRFGAVIAKAQRAPGSTSANQLWGRWHGNTLAFLDRRHLEVWQLANGTLKQTATITDPIDALALSWDGTRLALQLDQGPIRVVDPTGATLLETGKQYGEVLGFAGAELYVQDISGHLFRLAGGRVVDADPDAEYHDAKLPVRTKAWAEAGTSLLVGASGVLTSERERFSLRARIDPAAPIDALAWSAAGDQLAIASDSDITLLEPTGPRATKGHEYPIAVAEPLAYRGATSELWWLGTFGYSREGQIMTWDTSRATAEHMDADARPRTIRAVSSVCAVSGAMFLIQAGKDLELHDVTKGLQQHIHIASRFRATEPLDVERAMFIDNDRRLVVSGEGRTVVWNLALKVLAWQVADQDLVTASRDGRTIVTQSLHGIAGWDATQQRSLGDLRIPTGFPGEGAVTRSPAKVAAAFSPDGTILAVGSSRGTIELVDVASWKTVRSIEAHETEVSALAWRPDGKMLASGSSGGLVRMWTIDGTSAALAVSMAIGTNVLLPGSLMRLPNQPAPGSVEPDAWIALFPDGTAVGNAPGRRHLALRVGDYPLGMGASAPSTAPATAWSGLFAARP